MKNKRGLLAALNKSKRECRVEEGAFKKQGDVKHENYWQGRGEGVNDAILIVKALTVEASDSVL
jgi:hypothetical protein